MTKVIFRNINMLRQVLSFLEREPHREPNKVYHYLEMRTEIYLELQNRTVFVNVNRRPWQARRSSIDAGELSGSSCS
jgi:hypothetical protein